jgi:hypothetical protein
MNCKKYGTKIKTWRCLEILELQGWRIEQSLRSHFMRPSSGLQAIDKKEMQKAPWSTFSNP